MLKVSCQTPPGFEMHNYGFVRVDTQSEQRTRIYRVATLGAGIFIHLMVCWTVLSIGQMNIEPLQFLGIASLSAAGFLFFALAIVLEWNLSLEDPDMNLPQMIWAVSVVIMTSYFSSELKPVVVLSGLAMIVLGANRLSKKELLIFAAYSMSVYIASVSYKAQFDSLSWITEIVVMIAFGLVLVFGPVLYRLEMVMFENTLIDKNAELTTALNKIRELAIKDELTGAYNRRHLMEVLAQQKAMADRRDYKFSLCYVDLDFFKRVNDRFGHSTGDNVLKGFSEIAQSILRELDCVSRIGGEEFVLVLAGTSQEDAKIAARRIGEKLSNLLINGNEPNYRITASMGITEFRRNEEIEQTMDRADKALYDAKRTGRNKVIIAELDQ
ncbi:MAG: diguanylate cyclase (GGDEF)-like protein [Candidatus Azotimanducaceae bacterium]|jgi:diguanylate cyclase (GGDEF)-like protein